MIPTSPEAAMLGRFGDIPIGYYTGTADISVPLYTIKEEGLEIPIMLRYHGSGIKVEDQASNVGLGWMLEPGGAIIQIVNGQRDETDRLISDDPTGYAYLMQATASPYTNYFLSRGSIGDSPFPCTSPGAPNYVYGDSFTTISRLLEGHGQPDIYQYNFPGGYSGKFYINPESHQIVLIDKSADITFTRVNNATWQAKTLDGTVYSFAAQEVSTGAIASDFTGYTWKLSAITFHSGKVINFDYENGYYNAWTYNETYHSDYPIGFQQSGSTHIQHNQDLSQHYTKNIRQITTAGAMLQFNWEDREDIEGRPDADGDASNGNQSVKRIKSVDIYVLDAGEANYRKVKAFLFNYSYFAYNTTGGSYIQLANLGSVGKRLKLLSVQEVGYNANNPVATLPAYQFQYDETVTMPLKTSFARDYWGFYNGSDNTKLIPNLEPFNAVIRGNPMPSNIYQDINGANRATHKSLMKAYTLTKITYPTGGYTEFGYEPHVFTNKNFPDNDKLPTSQTNLYVMDQNEAGNQKAQQFTISSPINLQFNILLSAGHPDQGLNYYNVSAAVVKLYSVQNGVNQLQYTWQIGIGQLDAFNANGKSLNWTELVLLYPGTWLLTAELPDDLGAQGNYNKGATISASCNFTNAVDPTNVLSYGAGLRIADVKSYSSSGVLASHKAIRYLGEDNKSSGLIMSGLDHIDIRHMLFRKRISQSDFTMATGDIWFLSSESFTPYSTSASGNNVGYSRVVEEELSIANGSGKGTNVYNYHNIPAQTSFNMPEIPDMRNGQLLKKEIRNVAGQLLREENITYENKQEIRFYGVKATKNFMDDFMDGTCSFGVNNETTNYTINYYPIYSSWYQVTARTTKDYAGGLELVSNENFEYNLKGQLTKSSSTDSRARIQSREFLYPVDNPTDQMSATLIGQGLYNNLQRQTTKVSNVETSRTNISYRMEDGLVVQANISRKNGQEPEYVDVTFDRYGPYKTLRQFTKQGPPSSILWSYSNSRPIATFRNVSYSTLEALLGGRAAVDNFSALANPTKAQIDAFLTPVLSYFITRYAYDAATGLTSQTDEKGMTTYFTYDEFQRLKTVKDQSGNIIKSNSYFYKN